MRHGCPSCRDSASHLSGRQPLVLLDCWWLAWQPERRWNQLRRRQSRRLWLGHPRHVLKLLLLETITFSWCSDINVLCYVLSQYPHRTQPRLRLPRQPTRRVWTRPAPIRRSGSGGGGRLLLCVEVVAAAGCGPLLVNRTRGRNFSFRFSDTVYHVHYFFCNIWHGRQFFVKLALPKMKSKYTVSSASKNGVFSFFIASLPPNRRNEFPMSY
jgi:hypothetical protein